MATWLKRVYTDYDFFLTSNFLYNLPDPVIGVHRAIHGKLIKQGTVFVNGSQWSDPRADELMDKATIEPDPKKRAEYYHEVQKIVVDGSPIVWVFELNFPDRRQQALPRRDHEPARHLHQLRTALAGVGRLARRSRISDGRSSCRVECRATCLDDYADPSPQGRKARLDTADGSRWAVRGCCATWFGACCRRCPSCWAWWC